MDRPSPHWFNHDLACLFAGRALRSFSQAFMVIIVPLYLAKLGYNAMQLGIMFSVSSLVGAVLAAATGYLSDRFGAKTLLILISLMTASGGVVFAFCTGFILLMSAAALGTIGRGGGAAGGGGYGPYYPAEQALIAHHASDINRTKVFGMLSFVAVLGGALGSIIAGVPDLLTRWRHTPEIEGYRLLFGLSVLIGLAMAMVVIPVRQTSSVEARRANSGRGTKEIPRLRRLGLSRQGANLIWRFMVTNAVNGVAVGMLGPMLVYWFHRRYDVDATQLGRLYFAINLLSALPYLMVGRLAARLGSVATVVITRTVATVLLALMGAMPVFWIAGLVYTLRVIINTLSIPVRQSYLMGVIPAHERSTAAGLANFPSQLGGSMSPSAAGYLMAHVALWLPVEIAAALQGLNALLFYLFFNSIRPPEERLDEMEWREPQEQSE